VPLRTGAVATSGSAHRGATSSTPAPAARRAARLGDRDRAFPHRRTSTRPPPWPSARTVSAGWQAAGIARRSSYARTGPAARSDVRPSHLRRTAAPPLPFIVGSATATANPLVPVNPAACCSYRSRT
jgi:hypothetical protein